jgi:hypothetical protein
MTVLTEYLAEDYADFRTGQETTLEGERAWWRNILPADRDRIAQEVMLHADAYRRLGYQVQLEIGANQQRIEIHVRHRDRKVTTADIEILKGAMAATRVKAGWGGPG